jgi:hypothetical protein
MKRVLLIMLLFYTCSCNNDSQEKDKAHIQVQILLHNAAVGLRLEPKDTIATDASYIPNLDPHLTYDKLVQYCKLQNKDLLREADALTVK